MPKHEPNSWAEFESTQWSEVFRAQAEQTTVHRQALGELVRRYYPALYAHLVRRRRLDTHRANDVLQGFLTDKVVARRLVAQADPSLGKFRSLLIRSLDHYHIDVIRKESRAPATAGMEVLVEPPAAEAADAFDIAWAQSILNETLARMKSECEARQQQKTWRILECRLILPTLDGRQPTPYDELAHRFEFSSPAQATLALTTAKRTFNRKFAEVASDFLAEGDTLEELLQDLFSTLRKAGRLDWQNSASTLRPIQDRPADAAGGIDDSSPHLVLAMMESEPDPNAIWNTQDFGHLLQHQLAQPCAKLLHMQPADLFESGHPQPPTTATLGDLFEHLRVSLAALEAAKRFGRHQARSSGAVIPREVATVIYFGSISTALLRHNARISSSGDEVLRYGIERIREHNWLPKPLAQLFDAAFEKAGS